jgi:hypothetical protein
MAYYYYLPIALTIAANVFYHICQKSMPQNINPMLALIITYLTAAVLCVFILILPSRDSPWRWNWVSSIGLLLLWGWLSLGWNWGSFWPIELAGTSAWGP